MGHLLTQMYAFGISTNEHDTGENYAKDSIMTQTLCNLDSTGRGVLSDKRTLKERKIEKDNVAAHQSTL